MSLQAAAFESAAAAREARPLARTLIGGLFFTIALLLFAVSSGVLWNLGHQLQRRDRRGCVEDPSGDLSRLRDARPGDPGAAQSRVVLRRARHPASRHAGVPAGDAAGRRHHRARRPQGHRDDLRHLSAGDHRRADRGRARDARFHPRREADPRSARRQRAAGARRVRAEHESLSVPLRRRGARLGQPLERPARPSARERADDRPVRHGAARRRRRQHAESRCALPRSCCSLPRWCRSAGAPRCC